MIGACRIGKVRMKGGGAELTILPARPPMSEANEGVASALEYALSVLRERRLLGFAMVMRHEEPDGEIVQSQMSGIPDEGARMALLGLLRVCENRIIEQHVVGTLYDPRDDAG